MTFENDFIVLNEWMRICKYHFARDSGHVYRYMSCRCKIRVNVGVEEIVSVWLQKFRGMVVQRLTFTAFGHD